MVEVIESTLVVPTEETPKGKIGLSNFDHVAPIAHTCTVYHYRNNETRDFFSIEVLKTALAKTLVYFYPLAGRFMIGEGNRRVIDCNAEGALFVVARSEHSSDDIDFQPSPELRRLFVPSAASPTLMLMLQVTYLKCGGVVLGSATNHVLVDGQSAFHFFQTWASIARGDLDSMIIPSFDNTPLVARSPPSITFDHPEYENAQLKHPSTPMSRVTSKFNLSNKEVSSLKSQCKEERVSTFCVVAALFWKCYCIARELPPGTETRLLFSGDIRNRVHPPLPEKFFGNAVIRRSAIAQVSKIISNPIQIVANTVKAAIDGITDEYIRSFIDYVEVIKDKGLSLVKELPKSDLRIASLSGMPVYDADFGWGAPQLMTMAEVNGNSVVYIISEPGKDGGLAAFVSLDSTIMQKFEKVVREELCNSLQT
ncbi:hydroxycinnamoyltransferase 4-like [Carex rostrata]